MARNYDTTNGLPWPRASRVVMELDEAGNGVAVYTEQTAVLVNGEVKYLKMPETYHQIDLPLAAMTDTVPLINPATGAPLGGVTSGQALYLSALALIRADQLARDAAV